MLLTVSFAFVRKAPFAAITSRCAYTAWRQQLARALQEFIPQTHVVILTLPSPKHTLSLDIEILAAVKEYSVLMHLTESLSLNYLISS